MKLVYEYHADIVEVITKTKKLEVTATAIDEDGKTIDKTLLVNKKNIDDFNCAVCKAPVTGNVDYIIQKVYINQFGHNVYYEDDPAVFFCSNKCRVAYKI